MQKISILLLAVISAALISCNPDKESRVNRARLDFTTTDESELFFKNVRQAYYDQQEMAEAGMNVFRLGKRNEAGDLPVINLAIVHQWRLDEASIIIEPNAFFEEGEIVLKWHNATEDGELRYSRGNRELQQTFVVEVYDHLVAKDSMEVIVGGTSYPWPASFEDSEAYRITTFDYLRLVGVF